MTCAKKSFCAVLVCTNGTVHIGWNHAARPQLVCPRVGDEGYAKCHSVCATTGHAEDNAIRAAGDAAFGGFMVVDYYYTCDACMSKIDEKGITAMTVDDFLAAGGKVEKLGVTTEFKPIPFKSKMSAEIAGARGATKGDLVSWRDLMGLKK